MKKIIVLAVVAGFFAAGCATSGEKGTDQSVQLMTFDQALQKAQETRQQLQDAKAAYTQAQVVSEVAGASDNIGDAAKAQVKKQLNTAKQQIKAEKEAWKETLK